MKRTIVLSLLLCTAAPLLHSQKPLRFFTEVSFSLGHFMHSGQIETSEVTGFDVNGKELERRGFDVASNVLNWGVDLSAGVALDQRLFTSIGIRYQKRTEEGVCYCHVCDKILSPPTSIDLRAIEIPLAVRYNLLLSKKFTPFIRSELAWSKTLDIEGLSHWTYGGGVGVARTLHAGLEMQVAALIRSTFGAGEGYPRHAYSEWRLRVGVLKTLGSRAREEE